MAPAGICFFSRSLFRPKYRTRRAPAAKRSVPCCRKPRRKPVGRDHAAHARAECVAVLGIRTARPRRSGWPIMPGHMGRRKFPVARRLRAFCRALRRPSSDGAVRKRRLRPIDAESARRRAERLCASRRSGRPLQKCRRPRLLKGRLHRFRIGRDSQSDPSIETLPDPQMQKSPLQTPPRRRAKGISLSMDYFTLAFSQAQSSAMHLSCSS